MNNKYFELKVSHVPADQEDQLSEICFEAGASGISEDLAFQQPSLTYEAIAVEKDFKSLVVFFEAPPAESLPLEIQKQFPGVEVRLSSQENKDWLEEWKKGYEAFRFAGDFWIVPSWKTAPAQAKEILYIDPGMAFGTGTHETTRLAANLVIEAFEQAQAPQDITVIDVGTGTGVLAMIAARLGAKEVVGLDIDPECLRVARENFERNQISNSKIINETLEQVHTQYTVVIANIIDGILVRLKNELVRAIEPNGVLILSGILRENASQVRESFLTQTGLTLVNRIEENEWVALSFKRGAE